MLTDNLPYLINIKFHFTLNQYISDDIAIIITYISKAVKQKT